MGPIAAAAPTAPAINRLAIKALLGMGILGVAPGHYIGSEA
jgi:hypothetical protein